MKVWIDFSNSPHVLFFEPIIKKLEEQGHSVEITIRDFAQTKVLTEKYGIKHDVIGIHGGKNKLKKILNITNRAKQLILWGKNKGFDLAISHNSYAHCICSKLLKIPTVTLMDYEYQPANNINFRLADKVMVPFTFSDKDLTDYGAKLSKVFKYNGLKEDVYLANFAINNDLLQEIIEEVNIEDLDKKIIITIRTPPVQAAYHGFENEIFDKLINKLSDNPNIVIILLPRYKEQKTHYKSLGKENIVIPDKPLNGMHLMVLSDLVISAGGTMNREAAVLNTPAYTIYSGKMGSVDKHLISANKLIVIENEIDFEKIKIEKKKQIPPVRNFKVIDEIIEQSLSIAKK